MNNLRNKVQLIGNLGNAPEVVNFNEGKKLAKFSMATNEVYYSQKGEKVTETQWHNLVAWGKIAEKAEKYLDKGIEIAIDGKIVNRTYEDKAGNKRYITEIVVSDFIMLSKTKN